MGKDPRDAGQELDDQERTPEQVREEIERTREQLGDTVAELAHKTDVKAQAKRATDETKAAVTDKVNDLKTDAGSKKDQFTSAAREARPESLSDAGTQLAGLAMRHQTVLVGAAWIAIGMLIGRGRRR